jgi:hypothetical protein
VKHFNDRSKFVVEKKHAHANNTTTKPSPIWTATFIISHETSRADCLLSNTQQFTDPSIVKHIKRKVYAITKNIVASRNCALEGWIMFKVMKPSCGTWMTIIGRTTKKVK